MPKRVPEESVADDVHRGVRAALSTIPFAGGTAVELFNRLLAPPIQRRRDAWLTDLAQRVTKLEREDRIAVKDLQDNEEFASTFMRASQVAVRNHQKEKIEALRNAVLNVAVGCGPADAKREMFLALINELGVWHLRVLSLLSDPPGWFERNGKQMPKFAISSSLHQIIKAGMPDLAADRDFLEIVMKDLDNRKLASATGLMTLMSAQGATQKQTSDLGDEFIRFITAPKGEE